MGRANSQHVLIDAGADEAPPLVLASASATRARLLGAAGVAVDVHAADVDEGVVKTSLRAAGATAAEAARALAELKAVRVSERAPQALVIGADQILVLDGAWFEKPGDRAAARTQLVALRGRRHRLESAVCVALGGAALWHDQSGADLEMRGFSDSFLEAYLDAVGDDACASVGAYQVEGLGVQLFSRIEGDHFAILGLPLLPLLGFLRGRGALAQ